MLAALLSSPAFFWWCSSWCLAELLFLVIVRLHVVPRMNRLETPAKFPIKGKRLVSKIFEALEWLSNHQGDGAYDLSNFLRGWFHGTPTSELRRGNVVMFLAWAMYAKEVEDLFKSERKSVSDAVKMVEKCLGRTLEPGTNPDAVCIRHTLDPVVTFQHLPLVFYAFVGVFRLTLGRAALHALGFRRHLAPCGTFSYWFAEASPGRGNDNDSSSDGSNPLVFFHGVGIGLVLYLLAIWRLCRGRTAVIVESPSIMMGLHLLLGHPPPSESRLVDSIEGIMERHGLKKAAFFGHSFGSICVTWMVRRRPNLVSQVALLDPVCLLLFLPNTASSFLYPENKGMPFHEKLLVNLVGKEMGIAHTLRRHFWWYENTMWPEEIHCPMVVGLSEMDRLVPVQPIRRLLLSHPSLSTITSTSPSGPVSSSNVRKRNTSSRSLGSGGTDEYPTGELTNKGQVSRRRSGEDVSFDWSEQEEKSTEADAFDADGKTQEEERDGTVPKRVEVLFWPGHVHGTTMADPWALEEFDRVCRRQEQAFVVNRFS